MDADGRERLTRIRRRFIRDGIGALTQAEILELLLSYISPNADNSALSGQLLRKYHSLDSLLSSSFYQLRRVGGLDESRAFFLTLVNCVGRHALLEEMERREDAFADIADIGRYFLELVRGEPREAFYALCLYDNSFLACYQLTDGGVLSSEMETRQELIRRTVEGALKSDANAVALCHCLSGGVAAPSVTDRLTAQKIRAALNTVRVAFRDYFIVTDDDFTSLSETGLMERLRDARNHAESTESLGNTGNAESVQEEETENGTL